MRIGLISGPGFPVPPPAYGGIERVVDTLARGFTAAGHQVLLAAPSDSSCPVPLASGLPSSDSKQLGSIPRELSHLVQACKALGGMDIFHDHTLLGPGIPNATGGRIPAVTTIHGRLTPDMIEIYQAIGQTSHIIAICQDQVRRARLNVEPLFALSHLGGTAFPVQAMPAGLTPWYLEFEEISGLNFGGGGSAQIDLESNTFDWACG